MKSCELRRILRKPLSLLGIIEFVVLFRYAIQLTLTVARTSIIPTYAPF